MGHLANILDFQTVRRRKLASAAFAAPHVGYSDVARLILGVSDSASSVATDTQDDRDAFFAAIMPQI
jgi:hypothetical protein